MNKVININPALFSFSSKGGTRKKRASNPNIKIKVKDKENNKTTKRALLKYIRNQQEKNIENSNKSYNKSDNKSDNKSNPIISETDNFNSEFDESLKYLATIAEQNSKPEPQMNFNRTIKNNQNYNVEPVIYNQLPQSFISLPVIQPEQFIQNQPIAKMHFPVSYHGCLKGGNLPTFRNWRNQTQKQVKPLIHNQPIHNQPIHNQPISTRETELNKNIQKMSEITQLSNKLKIHKQKGGIVYPKQKKTVLRTYTVGKSKVFPKISVLVSNRTLRNNITTKTQLLKQTPINDVKKYLIKHGFIRVGSIAPNDVLRKMYESATLICGNINNHNPDNLLYNYFNDV